MKYHVQEVDGAAAGVFTYFITDMDQKSRSSYATPKTIAVAFLVGLDEFSESDKFRVELYYSRQENASADLYREMLFYDLYGSPWQEAGGKMKNLYLGRDLQVVGKMTTKPPTVEIFICRPRSELKDYNYMCNYRTRKGYFGPSNIQRYKI